MTIQTQNRTTLTTLGLTLAAIAAAFLAGCAGRPLPPPGPMPTPTARQPAPAPTPNSSMGSLPAANSSNAPRAALPPQAAQAPALTFVSQATSARDYRVDVAKHLYSKNKNRVYKGKMPPLLYAVGVLQVEVDARGQVIGTSWMRAPNHAPEVMADIERTVRAAAPYPAPVRLGRVTYTDTWLWHKSGTFQLDTLTEGQM